MPTKKKASELAGSGKETKNPRGQPTSYLDEYAEQAEKLCRLGLIDEELAKFFEVSPRTIDRWKKAHPDFCRALKRGKEVADGEVADRLYKRAIGYQHTDTKFATFEGKITDREEYDKHYPPDTIACIFWLKNRRPDLWRDKVTNEITGRNGGPIETAGEFRPTPEDEEVIKRIAEARERIKNDRPGGGEGA